MFGLMSFLGQATPMAPADIIALGTGAAGDIVDPTQTTYIVLGAVGLSIGIWLVRRTLKLGR